MGWEAKAVSHINLLGKACVFEPKPPDYLWEPAVLGGYLRIRSALCACQCCAVWVWMQLPCSRCVAAEQERCYLTALCGISLPAVLPPNKGLSTRRHPVHMWDGCFHLKVMWYLGFMLVCLPKAMVHWAQEGLSRNVLRSLFITEWEVYVLCAY